jgi:hypothetical protein
MMVAKIRIRSSIAPLCGDPLFDHTTFICKALNVHYVTIKMLLINKEKSSFQSFQHTPSPIINLHQFDEEQKKI